MLETHCVFLRKYSHSANALVQWKQFLNSKKNTTNFTVCWGCQKKVFCLLSQMKIHREIILVLLGKCSNTLIWEVRSLQLPLCFESQQQRPRINKLTSIHFIFYGWGSFCPPSNWTMVSGSWWGRTFKWKCRREGHLLVPSPSAPK